MTVETESRVGASLLYLAVDLGPRPTLERFGSQVNHVNTLWRHCDRVSAMSGQPPGSYRVERPLLITRTSLASPWVSVLSTVAEKSVPIAYGMAALFALQRLLDMVIAWQRHRFELQRSRSVPPQLAEELLMRHASEEVRGQRSGSGPSGEFWTHLPENAMAASAVEDLAPVLEAKMVDEDDPLARG